MRARRPLALVPLAATLAAALLALAAAAPASGWTTVEYGALIDGRAPAHSGEPVSVLLQRLGGRPVPAPGERPEDATAHVLLDPLLEPYGYVLSDALDALAPKPAGLVEIGSLWSPGEAQPAWVELLRARAMILESDGKGTLRAILPCPDGTCPAEAAAASAAAWDSAWPVLRHALAAERKRIGGDATLAVDVHAFRHETARARFTVATTAHRVGVTDTRPRGTRPPLDLASLARFFERGQRLEGARLDADGTLRLFGSESSPPPALGGRPLSLADAAVAYRAVFHGGAGEPYMSLDRGFAPQSSLVNYGGRLRDTALGLVSLLCDVRFKTFSQGIDPVSGADVRESLRGRIPGFRAHVERFSADARSAGVSGQQTRLWFYPDTVDLVLSAQGDVMALRRARMTAASERVDAATLQRIDGDVPPWTKEMIAAINGEYDAYGGAFPELRELDDAARLLALFAWLRQARDEGLAVPDLDALLAVELPAFATPRQYPQLLAVNALPPVGGNAPVVVIDRSQAAAALSRLAPPGGLPLAADRRLRRAAALLDPRAEDQAALAAEITTALERPDLDDAYADALAYRAERARMQSLSLLSLTAAQREPLARRFQAGEQLRVFSLGIGGLDLGMTGPLARARRGGARIGFGSRPAVWSSQDAAPSSAVRAAGAAAEPREEWRRDPADLPVATLPWLNAAIGPAAWIYGADGPEARVRRIVPAGKGLRFERWEDGRLVTFRFDRREGALVAERVTVDPPAVPPVPMPPALAGLAYLEIAPAAGETPAVTVRLTRAGTPATATDVPRSILQRLVMGRAADLTPDRPLPGLEPLPGVQGDARRVMVLLPPEASRAPWDTARPVLPGEEDGAVVAAALARWWTLGPAKGTTAVCGTDPARSPERWRRAPAPPAKAVLLLPADAFPGPAAALRDGLAKAWSAGPVVANLDPKVATALVVVASAEPAPLLAARLRALARDPALSGRLLAVLPLGGPVRRDLAGALVAEGRLAALGLAEYTPAGLPGRVLELAEFARGLAAEAKDRRVEDVPGPFAWFF